MSLETTPVVRGMRADGATTVRFDVDLARAGRHGDGEPVERVREQARAAGYAQGWAQGQQAARATAEAALDQAIAAQHEHDRARAAALHQALAAIVTAADRYAEGAKPGLAEVEDAVLSIAVDLAEALLGRELAQSTEPVREALHRALAFAPASERVTVRLHPTDLTELTGHVGEQEHSYQGRTVLLCPDPSLRPGDAIAQAGATTIDARLTEAMARVREVLGQ